MEVNYEVVRVVHSGSLLRISKLPREIERQSDRRRDISEN